VTEEPPPRGLAWVNAAKGLTIGNVLVLGALMLIAVPVYVIYRALGDDALLDRLMSTYEVIDSKQGCSVRHVQERGGPEMWGVSSGFAFQGRDRWYVNVLLDRDPTEEEIATYCESLKLIADRMLSNESGTGDEIYERPVPGVDPDRSGHAGDLPADSETETKE